MPRPPARSLPPVALLATLVLGLGGALEPAAAYDHRDWGKTGAPDRKLRNGCHQYNYHYVIDPPSDDWAAETFLVDPTGEKLASGAFDVDADPARGQSSWTICHASTVPGKFTIKMRVTWQTSLTEIHKGWVKPSTFRLSRKR
ncbi:hypothetical protein GCM10012276_23030 [Nocardioides deserti]|nr:hypothetical protein GCM10012276_23030 [Nocardioides deserti]